MMNYPARSLVEVPPAPAPTSAAPAAFTLSPGASICACKAQKAPLSERVKWFLVETAASACTLGGVLSGSTSTQGAALYLVSLVFWYALTVKRRLWGLMPLNVATTVVASVNLWRSLSPG